MNQYHISVYSEQNNGLSVCQVLERDGSPEVGKAEVFVSWALSMSVMVRMFAQAFVGT